MVGDAHIRFPKPGNGLLFGGIALASSREKMMSYRWKRTAGGSYREDEAMMNPAEFNAILNTATPAQQLSLESAHWRYMTLIGHVRGVVDPEIASGDREAFPATLSASDSRWHSPNLTVADSWLQLPAYQQSYVLHGRTLISTAYKTKTTTHLSRTPPSSAES